MREYDEINDDQILYECDCCKYDFLPDEIMEIRIESEPKNQNFCFDCIETHRTDPDFIKNDEITIVGNIQEYDSDETYDDWIREMNTDFKKWNI